MTTPKHWKRTSKWAWHLYFAKHIRYPCSLKSHCQARVLLHCPFESEKSLPVAKSLCTQKCKQHSVSFGTATCLARTVDSAFFHPLQDNIVSFGSICCCQRKTNCGEVYVSTSKHRDGASLSHVILKRGASNLSTWHIGKPIHIAATNYWLDYSPCRNLEL